MPHPVNHNNNNHIHTNNNNHLISPFYSGPMMPSQVGYMVRK
jgi:hypothetical protein